MEKITNKYLEYLRLNAIEASKHDILDSFIDVLKNNGVLKDFKYYLNSHSRLENSVIINKINEFESKTNIEIDFARQGR